MFATTPLLFLLAPALYCTGECEAVGRDGIVADTLRRGVGRVWMFGAWLGKYGGGRLVLIGIRPRMSEMYADD